MKTIWTKTMHQVMSRYSAMEEEEACIWIRGLLRCADIIRTVYCTQSTNTLDHAIKEILALDIYPYNPVVYQVGLGYESAEDIVRDDAEILK